MSTTTHAPGDVVNGHILNEDGTAWVPVTPQSPEKPKGSKKGLKITAVVILCLAAFGAVLSATGNTVEEPAASQTTVSAPADPSAKDEAPAPVEEQAPDMTKSQEQAVKMAENYLDTMAFSKEGLIEQLEFSGFSNADATFAVEHLEDTDAVDWNEQAELMAENYLDTMAFSYDGLVEQLEFSGFTHAQAVHGADSVF